MGVLIIVDFGCRKIDGTARALIAEGAPNTMADVQFGLNWLVDERPETTKQINGLGVCPPA